MICINNLFKIFYSKYILIVSIVKLYFFYKFLFHVIYLISKKFISFTKKQISRKNHEYLEPRASLKLLSKPYRDRVHEHTLQFCL